MILFFFSLFLVSFPFLSSSSELHCIPHPKPSYAYEILNPFNCTVYLGDTRSSPSSSPGSSAPSSSLSSSSSPSSSIFIQENFLNWKPSFPWYRNPGGIRYLTFDSACLYSSPGYPDLVWHQIDVQEPWNQANWVYMANGCAGDLGVGGCFPEACSLLSPKDGSLKWNEISKCHYMSWNANKTVSILSSPEGDQFILHATPTHETATLGVIFGQPKYPPGWKIEIKTFDKDFLLTPEPDLSSSPVVPNGRKPFGNFSCGYVVVVDSFGNSFHRIQNGNGRPITLKEDPFGRFITILIFHYDVILMAGALFLFASVIITGRVRKSSDPRKTKSN